ncbi:hypothetical protein [Nocardioides aurantiacus]|uniref:Uncharacterized protein n=1 Tax=Nocardioides aurantiacus TaxID=86796 RepID=A0A3N2CR53_9ACTN|nr:hypothetical protein [Nocardioides aurantiacus]ROR89991.1 hypothetical protein EDD33_0823 [Nocardioides aurantiacus]
MPEHTQTGRASLRLVDPDEPVATDPFALAVPRYRTPGPLSRPVLVRTYPASAVPPPDQVAGSEQTPPREKPS